MTTARDIMTPDARCVSETDDLVTAAKKMAELDIDLLIAGLYGHPRLQELILGGVSRQILHDVPAPLLISH